MTSLERQALRRGIRPPGPATLRRYGMTADEWLAMLKAQGWRCPICHKTGAGVVWNTDHHHVPGWKHMPPEERKRHVRGVLDAHCNHRRVHSQMGATEAQRIADYFMAYEARRDA